MQNKTIKEVLHMKKKTKIIVTLFIGLLLFPEYKVLCSLGSQVMNNNIIEAIVVFGWFWIICGKWVILSALWEE